MKKFNRLVEISRALYRPDHSLRTFHTTFILYGSKILSIGINNPRTHPLTIKYRYVGERATHSEMSAALKLGLEDCSYFTFVNVRLFKDRSVGMSKPCEGCMHLINQLRYKRFYYTDNNGVFQSL